MTGGLGRGVALLAGVAVGVAAAKITLLLAPAMPNFAPSSRAKDSVAITMRASISTWSTGLSSRLTRRAFP